MQNSEIRVLLVDDLASTRRAVKALFDFEPRIVVVGEAVDGIEALHLVNDMRPDLVLMDARMPVMDGIKATEEIKASWPETKVVVYTIFPGYQEEAYLAGADYFMIKGCSGVTPSQIILSFFPSEDLLEAES